MSVEYGLLIDYEFCTGCHSCEVACRTSHELGLGQFGIKILQDGPRECTDGKWEYTYLPMPTHLCDLCAERVEGGKLPSCVHHCQDAVMVYGTIEELAAKATEAGKDQIVIYTR